MKHLAFITVMLAAAVVLVIIATTGLIDSYWDNDGKAWAVLLILCLILYFIDTITGRRLFGGPYGTDQ